MVCVVYDSMVLRMADAARNDKLYAARNHNTVVFSFQGALMYAMTALISLVSF